MKIALQIFIFSRLFPCQLLLKRILYVPNFLRQFTLHKRTVLTLITLTANTWSKLSMKAPIQENILDMRHIYKPTQLLSLPMYCKCSEVISLKYQRNKKSLEYNTVLPITGTIRCSSKNKIVSGARCTVLANL